MDACACKLLAHPGKECPWWAPAGVVLGDASIGIDSADPWDGDFVELTLDLLPPASAHHAAELLAKSGFSARPSGDRYLELDRPAVA